MKIVCGHGAGCRRDGKVGSKGKRSSANWNCSIGTVASRCASDNIRNFSNNVAMVKVIVVYKRGHSADEGRESTGLNSN